MRLGALFSAVLDPSKPPLFGAGANLALLPQEAWHPSVAGTSLLSIPVQAQLHGTCWHMITCTKCFPPLDCRAVLCRAATSSGVLSHNKAVNEFWTQPST